MKDNINLNRETDLKTDKVFHLVLESNSAGIEKSSELVKEIANYLRLDKKEFYDLLLVMTEAVTNAVVHGNRLDAKKSVRVTCKIIEDCTILEVEDQGNGFDPIAIPNPLNDENLLKESGRGVFLMGQIAQKLSYTSSTCGTSLQIVMKHEKKQN